MTYMQTMTDAYVHVVAEPSAIGRAAGEIERQPSVEAVHLVTGEYDIIAQLDLESKDALASAVTEEIHAVMGVIDTETSVAFEP